MTVSQATAAEFRRLYFAEHLKRGTISKQLGVHYDVVVRVLGSFGPKAGVVSRAIPPRLSLSLCRESTARTSRARSTVREAIYVAR